MALLPTEHKEIEHFLELVLDAATSVLRENLRGVYVHGSLAMGGYDPKTSDVDILVITSRPAKLSDANAINRALAGHENFEVSFLPEHVTLRFVPHAQFVSIRADGSVGFDVYGPDWIIQLYIVRKYGIVVWGKAPRCVIRPVTPEMLRHAAIGTFKSWWYPKIANQTSLKDERYRTFAILTMCRIIYTARTGDVVSKTDAAAAVAQLFPEWSSLIQLARAGYPANLEEVVAFIQFTYDLFNQHLR